jgi:hypothetical protein
MPGGRPTIRNAELEESILLRLASGESLRSIGRDETMPDPATVWRWSEADAEFCKRLRTARETGVHAIIDEAREIADDGRNDWVEVENSKGETKIVLDREHVDRSKLRVEYRKWLASVVAPRSYGDRAAVELSGPNGGPVQVQTLADLVRGLPPPGAKTEPAT